MDIQSNLAAQAKLIPFNHIKPDFYVDPNCCSLQNAVLRLAIDSQADIPFIVWLFEIPSSWIALPGKIDLYGYDCIHALLNRGHSLVDEAFVKGFTMGNDSQTHWLHALLYKLVSSSVYPQKYRFSWKDFQSFDEGFIYGRSLQVRNLNRLNFKTYQNHTVSQARKLLGVYIRQ